MALVIFRILLFLLPFVLFALWVRYVKKHREKDGKLDPKTQKQIQLGSIVGIVVVLGTILFMGFSRPSNRDSEYSPPVLEDGKVKPATLTPKTEAPKTKND